MHELDTLGRHFGGRRAQLGTSPADRICVGEVPAPDLVALVVLQHDRAILPVDLSDRGVAVPTPEAFSIGETAAEDELRWIAHGAGQLMDEAVDAAFTVRLNFDFHFEAGDFRESTDNEPLDLDDESKRHVRIVTLS